MHYASNQAAEALAEFVSMTRFDRLPSEVIHEVKRRVLDVVGIALSASCTDAGSRIQNYVRAQRQSGQAVLWGAGDTVSPTLAALANGTMIFHMELDDVHLTSHTHPGVTTIIPALAVADELDENGREVITAVAVGYDVQARIGNAVSPSIYLDRPFLPPATLGTFGSAGVVAKLLGLGSQETLSALGTAAFLTPLALFENYAKGAATKELSMGWAGMSGIMAIELAQQGFMGTPSWLEGPLGFAVAAADRYDLERLVRGLGQEYEILRTGIKPYACCRQHHTAIDAALEIRERYNPLPDEIERVVHRTFKVASRGNDREPTTIAGAKYSAPYSISVALIEGKAWRDQYTAEKINDETVRTLARKVEVVVDPELEALYDLKWPSIVEVRVRDGQVYSARRDLPKGEPEYPVSDEELKEKFLSLACDAVSSDRAEALYRMIWSLEELRKTSELTALLRSD